MQCVQDRARLVGERERLCLVCLALPTDFYTVRLRINAKKSLIRFLVLGDQANTNEMVPQFVGHLS